MKQTEELFKNGKVTSGGGRGRALASGTAFSKGSDGWGKVDGSSVSVEADTVNINTKSNSGSSTKSSNSSNSSNSSSSSDTAEEFEETIDFIEIAISRIERAIDKLDQEANNIYKSWSNRNAALKNQISEVGREINLQESAAQRYLQEANSVGLSELWAERVRNGTIDIYDENDFDEDTSEKIKDYQKWYELYLDCIDAAEELKETESELYQQRFDNVITQYENQLSVIEHEKNMLDEYINQSEAQGWLVSTKYYDALAKNESQNIAKLQAEKANLLTTLKEGMESGKIVKDTEAWYDMCNQIDEVTEAIEAGNTSLLEYAQTIEELKWEQFDLLQDKISAVTEEADFLIELMSNDKLFDDRGQFTDEGMATAGLHGQNYNTYMYQADLAAQESTRLKAELDKNPYNEKLAEEYRERVSQQQESILAAEQEKEAIRDLVEEGISLELDALQELIDKKNEQLQSEKDLYEYQKKVKEQTEEIASLEKQMAAYTGDDSEEAKAKLQELKVSLEDAKENLKEAEYDKYISDQEKLLDNLYSEYEEILNARLDNIDALIIDMVGQINANADNISATLIEVTDSVGYTLSGAMDSIWNASTVSINGAIATYGQNFIDVQTNTNIALGNIKNSLDAMIAELDKKADVDIETAGSSSAVYSPEAQAQQITPREPEGKEPINNPQTQEANDIKVGGKINAGSAKIYDYAGDTSGERQYFRNDPIYTVLKEQNGYLLVRYHKLSSGVTGWFKKSDVKAYATGKKNILDDEVAWTQENGQEFIVRPSDGAILTPVAKGDSVLNAQASNNIWDMANSPTDFIKDNLNLGTINSPNNLSSQNVYNQNLDKVVFHLPNVRNYEELLSSLQKDPKFDKLIKAMTVDQIAGKSALTKGKSIR